MNRLLKYALIGTGSLIALVAVAIAFISATFNPNDYKPLIIKLVQDQKQRTLNIEGDIKLAFWPKLGADLGKITLSEHNGSREFAGMESAKVFLAVLPLLKKQLVVDTIRIDGLHANIVRFKDGSTNFDDLMSKGESQAIKFDIDGVEVTNAALDLTDQMANRHLVISDLKLDTGHIAKDQPIDLKTSFSAKGDNPAIDAKIQFKGTLLADSVHKQYGARGLDFALQGDVTSLKGADLKLSGDLSARPDQMEFTVDGLKLALKARLNGQMTDLELDAPSLIAHKDEVSGKEARLGLAQSSGDDTLNAKLVIADLKGSPRAFQSSGISGEITGKQGARSINGKFYSPFSGDLENLVFDLPKLVGNIDVKDPALPGGAMKAQFDIAAHADMKQEQAKVALAANVDGSKLNGNVAVAGFARPNVKFDLSADQLDLNKLLGSRKAATASTAPAKPADLSALNKVLAQGTLSIGSIAYDKYRIANLAATVKADGQTLSVSPLSMKLDDSQIKGSVGIAHFDRPLYTFDLDIDRLDVNRYMPAVDPSTASAGPAKPLDLSALKALNATGSLRIGQLKFDRMQGSNIRIDLKADAGQVAIAPFSANLYDGSMAGSLNVDARALPAVAFRQEMKGVNIGPLLVDALNNDMLEGRGALKVDVKMQGATVDAMKQSLNGNAGMVLADGAVKGIDIAGTIRDIQNKFNFKAGSLGADQKKRTDFSEMSATFKITNGVAHNDDLSMKSPLLRVTGSGDIDIGRETLNYLAKPTVVASLKGQGGADLQALNGLTFPIKVTGTFSAPKYGLDFSAIAADIAKKNLLGKVGGDKGAAAQKLMGGDTAGALQGLIGGQKKAAEPAPAGTATTQPAPAAPASPEENAKKKLNKLLGF
jgi:AsmA protein